MDYKKYIHSEKWFEKKKQYRASGLPQNCVICGSNKNIHLHHKTYKRLGKEKLTDLVPLCELCHADLHRFVKESASKRINNWNAVRILRKKKALA